MDDNVLDRLDPYQRGAKEISKNVSVISRRDFVFTRLHIAEEISCLFGWVNIHRKKNRECRPWHFTRPRTQATRNVLFSVWHAMVGSNRFASRISHENDDSYFTTGADLLGKCTKNNRFFIENNRSRII